MTVSIVIEWGFFVDICLTDGGINWCNDWIIRFIVVSEGDHEKLSKKELLLLGRRKEKKDKKDRGYATLDGESSPEEDFETK